MEDTRSATAFSRILCLIAWRSKRMMKQRGPLRVRAEARGRRAE